MQCNEKAPKKINYDNLKKKRKKKKDHKRNIIQTGHKFLIIHTGY